MGPNQKRYTSYNAYASSVRTRAFELLTLTPSCERQGKGGREKAIVSIMRAKDLKSRAGRTTRAFSTMAMRLRAETDEAMVAANLITESGSGDLV